MNTSYSVVEEDTSGMPGTVEVCVQVTGILDRSISVYLNTAEGTATGTFCSCGILVYFADCH